MTKQEKEELAAGLEALGDIDRHANCSDEFFRKVFTQKIRAILACGYAEKLRNDDDN